MTKLLILGHARHGKDTAAEYLNNKHGLSFRSSSLFLAERIVRPAMAERGIEYAGIDACYADRVNHRALWRELIEQYNADDAARLAKDILAVSDCYVGMRTEREYIASRPLFDHVIWVDASGRGLPPEPRDSMTITCDPGDMCVIENNGSLGGLYLKLDTWAAINGISR